MNPTPKLRQKDARRLEEILDKLKRGQAFLFEDDTLVCIRRGDVSTTLDFENAQGDCCTSINKHVGSELALLHTGIEQLSAFLAPNVEEDEQP